MSEMLRRRRAVGLTVGAVVVVAASAALPWARTGRVTRSAFGLARTANEIGALRGVVSRALFVGLAFLPAIAAAAWLAAFLGRRRVVATLGVVAGALALVGAIVVWRAPVDPGIGPVVGAVAGATAIVGSVAAARTERRR
jgi:hypothetical protein